MKIVIEHKWQTITWGVNDMFTTYLDIEEVFDLICLSIYDLNKEKEKITNDFINKSNTVEDLFS